MCGTPAENTMPALSRKEIASPPASVGAGAPPARFSTLPPGFARPSPPPPPLFYPCFLSNCYIALLRLLCCAQPRRSSNQFLLPKEATMSGSLTKKHPATWVPTLYFAEGLPFYAVNFMALAFYQRMGVSNTVITFVISLLAWPWTLKPLWSPLLVMYKTKKIFAVLGFCSSTHDIAADGIYIASLTPKDQAAYAGWQGAFFNIARIFSMGGLIWLTGVLQERFLLSHTSAPMVHAWMLVFAGLGFLLIAIAAYHAKFLPTGGEERRTESLGAAAKTFGDVVVTFFQKPKVILLLV